jgi:excisionase family DNA binding protein
MDAKKQPGKNRRKLSPDRLTMKPKETVTLTGLSVAETYRLLASGVMPSLRSGRKFLIPRAALIRWINNCGQSHITGGLKD